MRLVTFTLLMAMGWTANLSAGWETFFEYHSSTAPFYNIFQFVVSPTNSFQPSPSSAMRRMIDQGSPHPHPRWALNNSYGMEFPRPYNMVIPTSTGIIAHHGTDALDAHTEFSVYEVNANNPGLRKARYMRKGKFYSYNFEVTVTQNGAARWQPNDGANWFIVHQLFQADTSPCLTIQICDDDGPSWSGPSWAVRQHWTAEPPPANLRGVNTKAVAPFVAGQKYKVFITYTPDTNSNGKCVVLIQRTSTGQFWSYTRNGPSIYSHSNSGVSFAGRDDEAPWPKFGAYSSYRSNNIWLNSSQSADVKIDNVVMQVLD